MLDVLFLFRAYTILCVDAVSCVGLASKIGLEETAKDLQTKHCLSRVLPDEKIPDFWRPPKLAGFLLVSFFPRFVGGHLESPSGFFVRCHFPVFPKFPGWLRVLHQGGAEQHEGLSERRQRYVYLYIYMYMDDLTWTRLG